MSHAWEGDRQTDTGKKDVEKESGQEGKVKNIGKAQRIVQEHWRNRGRETEDTIRDFSWMKMKNLKPR